MKVKDLMQRSVTTTAEDESLGLALQLMLWNEVRHVPVLRPADGRVAGVISERDVLRARHEDQKALERQVREFMSSPAVHIHPNADLADAAADFATKRVGCLPVIDAGELVGIITASDVVSALAQCPVERRAVGTGEDTVASVMRPGPFVARAEEPLLLAAGRMLRGGVRHLCVVDAEGKLQGMLSDCDVRSAVGNPKLVLQAARLPPRLAKLAIGDAMTREPRVLRPEDPLAVAIEALLTERFGAMPVVDWSQRPVGTLSYVDVLQHVARPFERGPEQLGG